MITDRRAASILALLAVALPARRALAAYHDVPVPAKTLLVRPGRSMTVTATGTFAVPRTTPSVAGGTLFVAGTTGVARWDLPAGGWSSTRRLLRYTDGTCHVSFKYVRHVGELGPDPVVGRIKATCRGATGTLGAPEPGPVAVVLDLHDVGPDPQDDLYCAQCGGTPVGDPTTTIGATRCVAPASCDTTDCRTVFVCSPPDQCHEAPTCAGDGTCSYAPRADGTPCDDGVACTMADVCGTGSCAGTPFTCAPPDQCHEAGTCNGDGTCSYAPVSDATPCDDGVACTEADACQDGTCVGTPFTCEPPDECHQAGQCNGDGTCSYAPVPDDTPCTIGGDECIAGVCTQVSPLASLTVSPLTLRPAFAPSTHDYAVLCATGTNSLTLDMAAINGGTVALSAPVTTDWTPSASVTVDLTENQAAVIQAQGANGVIEEYWLRCLPHDFPLVSPSPHPELGTPTPGWYLIGNVIVAPGSGRFAMIVDANGTPLWYRRTAAAPTVVEPLPDATVGITLLANSPAPSTGTLYHLDTSTADNVATVGIPLDDHELYRAPNGDFLVLSYPKLDGVDLTGLGSYTCTSCTIFDCAVQEVDPAGNLVWDWRASAHVDPVRESVAPIGSGTSTNPADVFHCNSIDLSPDGDVLVSFRHACTVLLVSKSTGQVVWKLAGTPYSKDGATLLPIQDDPETTICAQHDARFRPNGNVSVFDDHSAFTGVSGPARGVEYALDLVAGSARPVWQYATTASSFALGSFRRYADGTNLIGWGLWTGGANVLFSEVDDDGHDLLDMLAVTGGNWSYRAEKVPVGTFDLEVLRNTAGLP